MIQFIKVSPTGLIWIDSKNIFDSITANVVPLLAPLLVGSNFNQTSSLDNAAVMFRIAGHFFLFPLFFLSNSLSELMSNNYKNSLRMFVKFHMKLKLLTYVDNLQVINETIDTEEAIYFTTVCINRVLKRGLGSMAQWIRRLPTEQEILGSSPGRVNMFFIRN